MLHEVRMPTFGCSRKMPGEELSFWTQVWRTSSISTYDTERSGRWKPSQPTAQDLLVVRNGIANWTTNTRSFLHC